MPDPGIGLWDGNLVDYGFFISSLAASATNVTVLRSPNGTTNIPSYKAFGDGFVIGVAAEVDRANAPPGTGTFQVTVNGTGVPVSVVLSAANGLWRAVYSPTTKFKARFKAGDTLGLQATTDNLWVANQNILCRVLVGYDRVCAQF